jgi:hypothetical protein
LRQFHNFVRSGSQLNLHQRLYLCFEH